MSAIKQYMWLPYVIGATVATFYVSPHESVGSGSYLHIVLKVFPIVYLIALVEHYMEKTQRGDDLYKKKNDGENVVKKMMKGNEAFAERRSLGKYVKYGLIASAIGDGFMIYNKIESFFLLGILCFAIGQSYYVIGFGFKRRNYILGFCIFLIMAWLDYVVLPNISSPIVLVGFAVYGLLLSTMIWRAIDRSLYKDGRSEDQNQKLMVGALIFAVSDLTIVYFKIMVEGEDISLYGQMFILATYYAAQGSIVAGSI